MNGKDDLIRENQALRERLSRLCEASLQINESLVLDEVLQGVVDNARHLTNARYGVISTMDEAGGLDAVLTSGTTEEEYGQVVKHPDGKNIFEHFSRPTTRLTSSPSFVSATACQRPTCLEGDPPQIPDLCPA